ncbi:MAG: hypothetical protein F6K22_05085 [Okeania sp. SIO2F4]|uniref:hypothetical protein n=1 Tax=Okeania sp. SIO2F4 TaxID=2607790 RepID=UPI00142BCEBF|nr:hypothetical protein [Okeania sp. SIO2F4]NES02265.1 hypothetical protein [Okeania sp. SIO2F4]
MMVDYGWCNQFGEKEMKKFLSCVMVMLLLWVSLGVAAPAYAASQRKYKNCVELNLDKENYKIKDFLNLDGFEIEWEGKVEVKEMSKVVDVLLDCAKNLDMKDDVIVNPYDDKLGFGTDYGIDVKVL